MFVIRFDPVGQKSEKKNLSLYGQKVFEISFDRFLVLVSATRDLQNDMFCQDLERRGTSDPSPFRYPPS